MSHRIYTTDAFVLAYRNKGEATRVLLLFTRDFGIVRVHAQGIRKLASKLRFSLDKFSFARVSLVRGREVWRLTNAHELARFSFSKGDGEHRELFSRFVALLQRLLGEEEKTERLFDDFIAFARFIEAETFSKRELAACEVVFVLRLLAALGYLKDNALVSDIMARPLWNKSALADIFGKEREYIRLINESFAASQL